MNAIKPKFIADGMLGSLARKLRIYSFDTAYAKDTEDEEILRLSAEESRILLTSDRFLASRVKDPGRVVLLSGSTDLERMVEICSKLQVVPDLDPDRARCSVCNGEAVKRVDKEGLSVPAGVLKRKDIFYVCKSCGKIYWEGGHWRRIREFNRKLHRALQSAGLEGHGVVR